MTTSQETVLVFGPTGGVGQAAALEANKRGAKVYLAMRDTSKPIHGLNKEAEQKLGFVRVQADLSKPETLVPAVKESGATAAFVYVIHESHDHMRASFEALKEAGIKYVVLLSTMSLFGTSPHEADASNYIPWIHAQAEVALEETGIPYVAARPGYFNSNVFRQLQDIKKGEVELLYPEVKIDLIAPEDIGSVCGALLASQDKTTKTICLCGPHMITEREAYGIIGQCLGREIKIKEIGEAEYLEKNKFMPEPIVRSLIKLFREALPTKVAFPEEQLKAGTENIRKYAGKEPIQFPDWVKMHQDAFA